MRFYVLLTECFSEWSSYIKKETEFPMENFVIMFETLKKKILFFDKIYYHYSNLEKIAEKDEIVIKEKCF